MKLEFWENELSEEKRKELIRKAANQVIKRGLETPAVLFLEMHKPLCNVGVNAAIVFAPFLVPFLGFDRINEYTMLLQKKENVEALICEIESSAKRTKEEAC